MRGGKEHQYNSQVLEREEKLSFFKDLQRRRSKASLTRPVSQRVTERGSVVR